MPTTLETAGVIRVIRTEVIVCVWVCVGGGGGKFVWGFIVHLIVS